ncbi:MAG: SRPBCC family protein [Burkholderiales bacterium]|nr:SRPBCC family protein [Ferrovum sp.]
MKFSQMVLGLGLMLTGVSALEAAQEGFFHEKVSQSIIIQAEPAKVWALIGDFDGMARWNATVAKTVAIDEDKESLTRMVVFKEDIGKEVDVLDDRSDADMTLRYRVTDNPWPVTRFNSSLRVSRGAVPGTSVVEWRAAFDVKGVYADPDAGKPSLDMPSGPIVFGIDIETYNNSPSTTTITRDKRTVKIITDLYRVGLDSLKWVIER